MTPLQQYRKQQMKKLPAETGVYALCDLDQVPIYVGLSEDGIRARVSRHVTSARSDVIANRQLDVWEVAFVWAWPVVLKSQLTPKDTSRIQNLEQVLYHQFNSERRLMNGDVPPKPEKLLSPEPTVQKVQILPDDEIESRKRTEHRLPRQIAQFNQLMDYILIVKNAEHLRESLRAHFERLSSYYNEFMKSHADPDAK